MTFIEKRGCRGEIKPYVTGRVDPVYGASEVPQSINVDIFFFLVLDSANAAAVRVLSTLDRSPFFSCNTSHMNYIRT